MAAVFAPPVLLALSFHEVAHGWAAFYLGDPTAAECGRLSLNPFRHIDPIGTVLVPGIMVLMIGVAFGWAKPVPVDIGALAHPRRDMALVALAGPLANLLMGLVWLGVLGMAFAVDGIETTPPGELLISMAWAGIMVNALWMTLNLIPLPPLDGSRVLAAVLPVSWLRYYGRLERFGLVIMIVLVLSGSLQKVFIPLIDFVAQLVFMILG